MNLFQSVSFEGPCPICNRTHTLKAGINWQESDYGTLEELYCPIRGGGIEIDLCELPNHQLMILEDLALEAGNYSEAYSEQAEYMYDMMRDR